MTKGKGITYKFYPTKGIKVCADDDFMVIWVLPGAYELHLALSRTGSAIKITHCLEHCISKMRTEVIVFTLEVKCISLFQRERDTILIKTHIGIFK